MTKKELQQIYQIANRMISKKTEGMFKYILFHHGLILFANETTIVAVGQRNSAYPSFIMTKQQFKSLTESLIDVFPFENTLDMQQEVINKRLMNFHINNKYTGDEIHFQFITDYMIKLIKYYEDFNIFHWKDTNIQYNNQLLSDKKTIDNIRFAQGFEANKGDLRPQIERVFLGNDGTVYSSDAHIIYFSKKSKRKFSDRNDYFLLSKDLVDIIKKVNITEMNSARIDGIENPKDMLTSFHQFTTANKVDFYIIDREPDRPYPDVYTVLKTHSKHKYGAVDFGIVPALKALDFIEPMANQYTKNIIFIPGKKSIKLQSNKMTENAHRVIAADSFNDFPERVGFNLSFFRKVLKKLKQNKEEIATMKIVDDDRMVIVNNKIGLMPMMITE